MEFLKKNWLYILVIVVVSGIIISYIYLQFLAPSKIIKTPPLPPIYFTPTATPFITPIPSPTKIEYQGIKQIITEEDQTKINQQLKVYELTKKLPFAGKNFNLSYDLSTNTFTATLANNVSLANQELDEFLKSNGVERSWIKHLVIK